MIMQLLRISKTLEQSRQEEIEKKCRRCVHIFKSDDFYYFFDNVEEEFKPILDSLLNPAWWVTTISQFPMQNLFVDKLEIHSILIFYIICNALQGREIWLEVFTTHFSFQSWVLASPLTWFLQSRM